jgi:putative component of membrane protein insertase Oxa1/YidC/SpoIIIJ protein YidD
MSTIAVAGIDLYRRYLSPLKGFRCAHHALHGTGSCSTFGREVYATHGFIQATRQLRARFTACKQASVRLQAMRLQGVRLQAPVWLGRENPPPAEDDKDGKKKQSTWWDCGNPGDCINFGSSSADCGSLPCDCGF